MLIGETIAVALASIRANLMRAALTMLGIVIGVGAVITMVALGTGAQRSIEEQIDALGARKLTVFAGQSRSRGVASSQRAALTTDDAMALARDAKMLSAVVPEIRGNQQVKFGNTNINVRVVGSTPNYDKVNRYQVAHGRMFTEGDDMARKRVAVLGYAVPEMLDANPAAMINQRIFIKGIPFEIIGVFAEKGSTGSFSNPDERVLIPVKTAQYRVFGSERLGSITVEVADGYSLDQGMVDVEVVLRREHKIPPGKDNDFRLFDFNSIMATRQEATEVFTYLLASIAGVSLLVGGIGIMNIMLVSVTERTREIGIRKAMGATRMNILLQFLVEALTLCMLGGVIGIILGTAGAMALAHFANWNTLVSLPAIGMAFAFSAGVGLFFGIWPARRASMLDPIDALRYE